MTIRTNKNASESLMALTAPMTTKCDFCYVYFCGISIPQRCVAALLLAQHLHNMADTSDLVSSTGLYESFNNNPVEADYLLDYMRAQRLTPRHIYREAGSQFHPFITETRVTHQFIDYCQHPVSAERICGAGGSFPRRT